MKFKFRPSISEDDCFRTAIANILQLNPKTVPDFIHKYKSRYLSEAQKWLNRRGKSIIWIPVGAMVSGYAMFLNKNRLFPQGYCMVCFEKKNGDAHVEVLFDGKIVNGNGDQAFIYEFLCGYFLIYDLHPFKSERKSNAKSKRTNGR